MKTNQALTQIEQEIAKLTTLRSLLSRLDSIPDDTAIVHLFGSITLGIHYTFDPKEVCRTLGGEWKRERFRADSINYEGNLPGDIKATIFNAELEPKSEPFLL